MRKKISLEDAERQLEENDERLAAVNAEKRRLDLLGVPPIEEVLKTQPLRAVLRYRLSVWKLDRAIARVRRYQT